MTGQAPQQSTPTEREFGEESHNINYGELSVTT